MPRADNTIFPVGIDTGGTFTDIAWFDGQKLKTAKVPSRPDNPANAVLDGLRNIPGGTPMPVCHGTTVGTNAILARHGGPAHLVVTTGFRDVLHIGRGERSELYSASPSRPMPLLDPDKIDEINLRIDSEGKYLLSPGDAEINSLAILLKKSGAKAIGLCILHSAVFPEAESDLAGRLRNLTGLPVYASASLAAFPREFERWTLTSVAAYLAPVLGEYLSRLSKECPGLLLMTSSGGLVGPGQVLDNPARCVLSGPAGGALAAMSLGHERVLALDMGGTSTDVTLLAGKLPRTREAEIDGLPIPLPAIDIHTIGAGGGSIVKIDTGGMLALGPESAGAMPGPACYGNGGPPALSDVALLAGRLLPDQFLAGTMPLEPRAAREALTGICPAGMTIDSLLDGVIDLAIVHLTGALRKISIARGIDPAHPSAPYILVPFGGAGALFACECARALGLKKVIHPGAAGVFSAIGLLQAPIVCELERAVLKHPAECSDQLTDIRRGLIEEINLRIASRDENKNLRYYTTLECRYRGQSHSLEIPLPEQFNPGLIIKSFSNAYKDRYTYTHDIDRVEIVTVRVRGEIPRPKIEFPDIDTSGRNISDAFLQDIKIRHERRWIDAPVLIRDRMPVEEPVDGPALMIEDFATLYLAPDTVSHLDTKGHMNIEMK